MKTIVTWLAAGVVAAAAAGCSVEVTEGDGGTATGGAGGSGATGGTGGGGTGGTGGVDAGPDGSSGSAGTAGSAGSGGSSGDGGGMVMCSSNPNDPACTRCAFNNCMMEACACGADSICLPAMIRFNTCIGRPMANLDDCATTFAIEANVDGGGGLANDLASCMDSNCFDTCQSTDAGGGG